MFFTRTFYFSMNYFIICIYIILWSYATVNGVTYKIPLVYSSGNSSITDVSQADWVPINRMQEAVLRGKPGQGYYITLNVGTPPQKINVLVDTGSSNLAIAAVPNPLIVNYFHANESTTYKQVEPKVFAPYTQGSWEGALSKDEVTFENAADLSINAYLATITKSENFFINGSNWQGILGLAYAALARPNSSIIPFFDQLVTDKHVSNVFSLQLCGQNSDSNGGMLVVGGVDPKLYYGEIIYTPLHREWYYEVILTDITVGDISIPIDCKELNNDKAIVDSGTTSLRLPRKVFDKAVEIFKRQVQLEDPIVDEFWAGNTVMCWLSDNNPLKSFPKLRISMVHSRNSTFTLLIPPQQYLRYVGDIITPWWMRKCYRFAINPSDSGAVLGTVVLEGFYIIFDRQNKRIGFSKATCDNNNPKFVVQSQLIGPFNVMDPLRCAFNQHISSNQTIAIAAYVMAGISGLCLIILLILLLPKLYSRCKTNNEVQPPSGSGDLASLMEND